MVPIYATAAPTSTNTPPTNTLLKSAMFCLASSAHYIQRRPFLVVFEINIRTAMHDKHA